MKIEKTKVIFRIFPKREGGDVIAILPQMVGTNDPHTCMSYQIVGEHGSCDLNGLALALRLATPGEYKDTATALKRRGYKLDIRKRATRADYEERVKQLNFPVAS